MAFEPLAIVGGLTQGAARILGLSKTARLRRGMNEYVKLYSTLEGHDELKGAAADIAGVVEIHARQLARREIVAANRTYDWGYLGSAILRPLSSPHPFLG